MAIVRVPTALEQHAMMLAFTKALHSCVFVDHNGISHPLICAICDTMAHVNITMEWIDVNTLRMFCQRSQMTKLFLDGIYLPSLIEQYTAPNVARLREFVLSPASVHDGIKEQMAICKPCADHIRVETDSRRPRMPPKEAIISGYLIGDAPSVLTALNAVELAILTPVRTNCQTWIFFGGCHEQIKGWHTFYENRPAYNVATLNNLAESGMQGQLLVVLCGPFTPTQRALAQKHTLVDAEKIIAAYKWLEKNNYHYHGIPIPSRDELPIPILIDEHSTVTGDASAVTKENEVIITVLFPDSSMPTSLNGGFRTQDEFRNFAFDIHQDGKWTASIHARPTDTRIADYKGEALAKAFPLLFPFGHSGCAEDPAVAKIIDKRMAMNKRNSKRSYLRTQQHLLNKLLRHRKPGFQSALFNLIAFNVIMKQSIFQSVRFKANYHHSDGVSMGEKYGLMDSEQLMTAVTNCRNNHSAQFSSRPADQFLRSIYATCRDLPHTNEASSSARKVYFSYLSHFGLPSIFLTVTPDDKRYYRIVLYALTAEQRSINFSDLKAADMSDEDIIKEYKIRREIRTSNPGLCAEEYQRIITLIIKHLFNWDVENQKSNGIGCFGELEAWCLATEEQGRKTLHGHFLLFVKNWQLLMEQVQLRATCASDESGGSSDAEKNLTEFCRSISSARILGPFHNAHNPFDHECASAHSGENHKRKYVEPVDDQTFREMRHKDKCNRHGGLIGKCPNCDKAFTVNDIVEVTLRDHLGSDAFQFPDRNKRLEHHVYKSQQEPDWFNSTDETVAVRYLAHNCMVNVHNCKHATRCFKNSDECYANLPEMPLSDDILHFKKLPDDWFDYKGNFIPRSMFRFYPKREIEDVFMNVHSQVLTECLANNTNVMAALNGPVVFYVTGYQTKSQQPEEKEAFAKVVDTVVRMQQRVRDEQAEPVPPNQEGFTRLIAGIYAQTSAHVIAAPMAHYLAINDSRFLYSHDNSYFPTIGIESYLMDEATLGTIRIFNGQSTWYHKAMDYIYRSKTLEHMSMLKFWQDTKSMKIADADREGIPKVDQYEFFDEHPFHDYQCMVYQRSSVAIFPWNWLQSTADFEVPLTEIVPETHKDFSAREEYCRRFLMLFFPFRTVQDLKLFDMQKFQYSFAVMALGDDGISDEIMRIANNIQDIHNSIRVTMPPNMLTDVTYMLDDEELKNMTETETNRSEQNRNLIELLATELAQAERESNAMTGFAKDIHPRFMKTSANMPKISFDHSGNNSMLPADTVVYEAMADDTPVQSKSFRKLESRFRASVVTLNTLVLQTLLNANVDIRLNNTDNATGSVASIRQWCTNDHLDMKQQIAAEIMIATYVLTFHEEATGDGITLNLEALKSLARRRIHLDPNEKLRMFITGPAGAGKSKILESMLSYCKAYSTNIHHEFTRETIRMTALTGSAGVEIGGDTACREFGLKTVGKNVTFEEIESYKHTRLNIVDEIGFANQNHLKDLSENLRKYTQCTDQIYGSIAIVFIGDFCQLPTIGGKKIYDSPESSIYWEHALNQLVELDGHHRYADDPDLGIAMAAARTGNDTELRRMMKLRVIETNNLTIPSGFVARYATHTNKKRASINANVFKNYTETFHHTNAHSAIPRGAIIIRGSATWGSATQKLGHLGHKKLWEECCDADIKHDRGSKLTDPFLCLFAGCELMVNDNLDVKNGIANGTCCQFVKAVLKNVDDIEKIQIHGRWVNSVCITNVDHIVLRFDKSYNPRFQGIFKLKPTEKICSAYYPINENMFGKKKDFVNIKLTFLPVIGNYATTAHKLQGKTMPNLVIAEWAKTANWAYVVLSRVRTWSGIFLVNDLPDECSFAPPQNYVEMMQRLGTRITALPLANDP